MKKVHKSAMFAALAGTTAAVVALSISAGTASSENLAEPGPLVAGAAKVDLAAGKITRPSEEYFPTQQEHEAIFNAHTLAIANCAERNGIAYHYGEIIPETETDRDYGLWVPAAAKQAGYAPVESEEKKQAVAETLSGESDVEISDADFAKLEQNCANDPDVLRLTEHKGSGPWSEGLGNAWTAFQSSDVYNTIRNEWAKCLSGNGIDAASDTRTLDAAVPRDAYLTSSAATRDVAIVDANCKQSIDMIQRLADLHAAYEAPVLDEWSSELSALHDKYEQQVADAEAYLAKNGH
ncbi:hypothetical protein [Isoptericola sp. NPDC056605]|uniref:hypothetical protein n=1 Tax=Isoptericola sp. NPDC056605 TaxID=3345876 RepID=UPI003685A39E